MIRECRVDAVFQAHRGAADLEMQQRACEYFAMLNNKNDTLMVRFVCELVLADLLLAQHTEQGV